MINEIIEKAVAKSVDEYIDKLLSNVTTKRMSHGFSALMPKEIEKKYTLDEYIQERIKDRLENKITESLEKINIDQKTLEKVDQLITDCSKVTLHRY